jgi:glycosyltransferase involved in cell wall biosynthesis
MNILFTDFDTKQGSSFFRLYQPLIRLAQYYPADIQALLIKKENVNLLGDEDIQRLFWGADIFFTLLGNVEKDSESYKFFEMLPKYNEFRRTNKRNELNLIIDVDDYMLNCNPFNAAYVFSGEKETIVDFDNGEEVIRKNWKTGMKAKIGDKEMAFDPERNKKWNENKKEMLKRATVITTTTQKLADKIKEFNPNVFVLPNFIDFVNYEIKKYPKKEIRIGYVYSGSHLIDWLDILPALRKVINETPFVKLVLFGPDIPVNGLDPEKIEWHNWKNIEDGYFRHFSSLNLDIGLAPLFNDNFNIYKSPLKFLEYSALKIPTLASEILYKDYIKDGKTGLVYKDLNEFTEKLKALIKNKALRESLADNAYNFVRENYSLEAVIPKYKQVFEYIINKKPAEVEYAV